MAIYKNRIVKNGRVVPRDNGSIGTTNITGSSKPPKWINPTAFVLAKRNADGSLEQVYIDNIDKDYDNEQLRDIAAALIGTQYLVLRNLFLNRSNLLIQLQTDDKFDQQTNLEAKERLKAMEPKRKGGGRRTKPTKPKRKYVRKKK